MLVCRNAKGEHGRRKVGNSCSTEKSLTAFCIRKLLLLVLGILYFWHMQICVIAVKTATSIKFVPLLV